MAVAIVETYKEQIQDMKHSQSKLEDQIAGNHRHIDSQDKLTERLLTNQDGYYKQLRKYTEGEGLRNGQWCKYAIQRVMFVFENNNCSTLEEYDLLLTEVFRCRKRKSVVREKKTPLPKMQKATETQKSQDPKTKSKKNFKKSGDPEDTD